MDITKKLRYLMHEKNITGTELAERINTGQSNLSQKMKNQSYSVNDLVKIAAATDTNLEINFVMKNGNRI